VLAPAVKITSPTSGAVATTSATLTGTSSRATLVQVRVGSAVWTNATGVASWTVTFDLSMFPNGPVVFEARAFNGTVESAHDSITVQKAPAALALDRCTVRPGVVAVEIGGTQAFAASGWNGTTEIAGVSAAWSVIGNIGNVTPGGVFTATTAGTGSVVGSVTYSGRSAACSSNVTVTAGPPPTVAISSPSSGANVTTNLIVVRGTSSHADAVQIRAGNGLWSAVGGTVDAWSAQLDLSGFANMQALTIEARAFNGSAESTHDQIYVVKSLPLVVLISAPAERAQVSGTLTVTGTTTPGSTVQIRFDAGMWVNASTSGSAWSYRIDTTTTFDGDHLIEARAVWGASASPVVARDVVVSNNQSPRLALPQPVLWGLAVVIPLAGLVVAPPRLPKAAPETRQKPPLIQPGPRKAVVQDRINVRFRNSSKMLDISRGCRFPRTNDALGPRISALRGNRRACTKGPPSRPRPRVSRDRRSGDEPRDERL